MTSCRVCGARELTLRGQVQGPGATTDVHDCTSCGTRQAPHDARGHERLHADGDSAYSPYHRLAEVVAAHLERGDVASSDELLRRTDKFAWILDAASALPGRPRILELGCSTGFLTGQLRAMGLDAEGVDVSRSAVTTATRLFGPHFHEPTGAGGATYNLVFHLGTIGCVPDPVGFTEQAMAAVGPGGRLLFNAPNLEASPPDEVWGVSAVPPDLVSVFPPGLWRERFDHLGRVDVSIATISPEAELRRRLRPGGARTPSAGGDAVVDGSGARVLRLVARSIARGVRLRPRPDEFGVRVTIERAST